MIFLRICILIACCFFGPAASGQGAGTSAVAVETAPYFDKPSTELLAIGFIEKHDSCSVDSAFVDSSGMPWFCIRIKNRVAWVHAASLRYVSEVSQDFFSRQAKGDDDKKRRLEILQNHPGWPHRIKMAVKNGQVCLDMSEEQLSASWGQPLERKKSFMLGIGDYLCLLYKGESKGVLFVFIQNDRVIGWSRDE